MEAEQDARRAEREAEKRAEKERKMRIQEGRRMEQEGRRRRRSSDDIWARRQMKLDNKSLDRIRAQAKQLAKNMECE